MLECNLEHRNCTFIIEKGCHFLVASTLDVSKIFHGILVKGQFHSDAKLTLTLTLYVAILRVGHERTRIKIRIRRWEELKNYLRDRHEGGPGVGEAAVEGNLEERLLGQTKHNYFHSDYSHWSKENGKDKNTFFEPVPIVGA